MKRLQLPTLLLVTESPSIRHGIKKHLDAQFFILQAKNGVQAVNAIRTTRLDLILLDADLENPLALCQEMKKTLQNAPTPILLITGRLKKSFRDAALDAGVTDFLHRGLELEEIETRIAMAKRAEEVRDKTTDLSSAIPLQRKEVSAAYLKNKFLLHDQAVRMLTGSRVDLLVIRIDNFPDLQTKFGYLIADELLLLLSKRLEEHLRETDLLIPSNEGFLLLLAKHETSQPPKKLADSLRNEVEKEPFQTKSGSIELTISIAFTSLDAKEHELNRMIATATKALRKEPANLTVSLEELS